MSALLLLPLLLAAQPAPPELDRYCLGCHNAKLKTAGLDIKSLDFSTHSAEAEKVIRRLRARQMPPTGLPRPDEATYKSLVSSLATAQDKAAQSKPNPGRSDTFRRLTRTEYQNAIRDILSVDLDVSTLLPSDESSHGFDNITVGDLSPSLLERYLGAARKISRLAVGTGSKTPGGDTFMLPPDLTQEDHFDKLPIGTRGGMVVNYTFPLDADYDIAVRLTRDRNEHVEGLHESHDVEILVDGERIKLFTVVQPKGTDHSAVDKHLIVRIPLKAGPHVIAADFPKKSTPLLETERQPYPAHFNMDRHPRIQPGVYTLSVQGPYDSRGPGDTPSRRRIFVCSTQDDACAKRIFTNLARHAYRRPVTDADLVAPLRFYRDTHTRANFDESIEMGVRAILVSPEFLFRVERDPASIAHQTAYRISDLELASRLSFFLWSSVPDDELLKLAEQNTLHTPATLQRQTRRLLADPRSRTMIDNFASQWLYLRNLDAFKPDMRLFADFDDNLRQAFRRETELFVEDIMRQDKPITQLLQANYTFLNERLAKHYGIPNVYGSHFRRVDFGADRTRGGLLRQGSILMVNSYPTRTSPVIRGKWVLDNILGVPPPPPPPDVPALKERAAIGANLSMRERLAEHRADPACAGCHKLMDPIGFAMENYDAVGRLRLEKTDVSGAMYEGSKFEGIEGLERVLLSRPEIFATTFTEKLMTYALGRGVEYTDAPAIRSIVNNSAANNYRFSSYILGVVGSPAFQMRRSQ